jgi:hypothetical protein
MLFYMPNTGGGYVDDLRLSIELHETLFMQVPKYRALKCRKVRILSPFKEVLREDSILRIAI